MSKVGENLSVYDQLNREGLKLLTSVIGPSLSVGHLELQSDALWGRGGGRWGGGSAQRTKPVSDTESLHEIL